MNCRVMAWRPGDFLAQTQGWMAFTSSLTISPPNVYFTVLPFPLPVPFPRPATPPSSPNHIPSPFHFGSSKYISSQHLKATEQSDGKGARLGPPRRGTLFFGARTTRSHSPGDGHALRSLRGRTRLAALPWSTRRGAHIPISRRRGISAPFSGSTGRTGCRDRALWRSNAAQPLDPEMVG